MILSEDIYISKIKSYSKNHWQPLMDLIPEIETSSQFGENIFNEKGENGIAQMPFWNASSVVGKFQDIAYELAILVDFDWAAWDEGKGFTSNQNFNFDTIDIPTKCKLMTAIIRNNRFLDGALVEAFESGLILKILKSIDKQLNL